LLLWFVNANKKALVCRGSVIRHQAAHSDGAQFALCRRIHSGRRGLVSLNNFSPEVADTLDQGLSMVNRKEAARGELCVTSNSLEIPTNSRL